MNMVNFKAAICTRGAMGALLLASVVASAPAAAGTARFQAANLHELAGPSDATGAVTLMRTRYKVIGAISATGLDPNAAYTAWWVVFNNPRRCASSPCTAADLRTPGVAAANFLATGFLTDSEGTANVRTSLRAGRLPRGVDYIDLGTGRLPGLRRGNGLRAEIHLVLRSHGDVVPGEVAKQISSGEFGSCAVCVNQLAAIFLPAR